MTSYTTPHSLPIIEPAIDKIAATGQNNLAGNINALALATQLALDTEAQKAEIQGSRIGIIDGALEYQQKRNKRNDAARRVVESDSDYAQVFSDSGGSIAAGIKKDATFNFEKPITVMGLGGVAGQPIHAPGYSRVFVDQDGYASMAIRDDGTVDIYKGSVSGDVSLRAANDAIGYTRSRRDVIVVAGDSLSAGWDNGSGNWAPSESWPGQLAEYIPSTVTIKNRSTSGDSVEETAIRVGAVQFNVSVTGGSIPASGTVALTTTQVVGWVPGNIRTFTGSLAGVPGTITRDAAGVLVFARTTAGADIAASGVLTFAPEWAGDLDATWVVFLGRNDITAGIVGTSANTVDHVVDVTMKIVDHLTPQVKQVLLVGTITRPDETSGTTKHTQVTAIRDALIAKIGPRFLDIRNYLATQCIYDLGLTPTPADLTAMAGDTMPMSLVPAGDTGTHYSKAVADALAKNQFAPYLTTRGWV